jgi:hypothetical protein
MLCSATASALQIVFNNSLYESTAKWEMSDFQRGQTIGARLAGTSVTKTGTLLGVPRQQFPRLSQHKHVMGRLRQLSGTEAENN